MARTRKLEHAPTGRKDVTVSHREKLITELRGDRELTAAYLNAAAEDGDQRVYIAVPTARRVIKGDVCMGAS